jgi:hypothetical protein
MASSPRAEIGWKDEWRRAATRPQKIPLPEPGVFGRVASDLTVSRLVDTRDCDVDPTLRAVEAPPELRPLAFILRQATPS